VPLPDACLGCGGGVALRGSGSSTRRTSRRRPRRSCAAVTSRTGAVAAAGGARTDGTPTRPPTRSGRARRRSARARSRWPRSSTRSLGCRSERSPSCCLSCAGCASRPAACIRRPTRRWPRWQRRLPEAHAALDFAGLEAGPRLPDRPVAQLVRDRRPHTAEPQRPRTYPNLRRIVVAGHSAGGQFVVRYTATDRVDSRLPAAVRHVAATPSSYPYHRD
jgi:hypothetical protein